MLFGFVFAQIWLLRVVQGIDTSERVGPCIPGFDVSSTLYMTSDEGIWFPQYRVRQVNNKRYSCHTLYERLATDDGKQALQVDSYFTKDGKPLKNSYTQTYTQEKRGVLVDLEDFPGIGEYHVKNYIIKLTPDYRVRYVCTDFEKARKKDGPVVYIETRSMTPASAVINEAVKDIQKYGISVVLDRIVQKNCTRPLDHTGYPETNTSE